MRRLGKRGQAGKGSENLYKIFFDIVLWVSAVFAMTAYVDYVADDISLGKENITSGIDGAAVLSERAVVLKDGEVGIDGRSVDGATGENGRIAHKHPLSHINGA